MGPGLDVSIIVTTFLPRRNLFKDTFRRLCTAFPSELKVVSVDGWDWDPEAARSYQAEMRSFLDDAAFSNVVCLEYPETTCLAARWNRAVETSREHADNYFIVNDDVYAAPGLRRDLAVVIESNALMSHFGCFNYFLINSRCLDLVGPFDEGFSGIGEEDGDFEIRLFLNGGNIQKYSSPYIRPSPTPDEKFYTNPRHQERRRRNVEYMASKYDFSAEPAEGFVFVPIMDAYCRPKSGTDGRPR